MARHVSLRLVACVMVRRMSDRVLYSISAGVHNYTTGISVGKWGLRDVMGV
jgi:hypothetical protein